MQESLAGVHPDRIYNTHTLYLTSLSILVQTYNTAGHRVTCAIKVADVAQPISSQWTESFSSRSTLQKLRLLRHGKLTRTFVLFRLLADQTHLADI